MQEDTLNLAHGAIESPEDKHDWTLASAGASTIYPDENFIDIAYMIASMQSQIGCCVGCTFEEIVRHIVFLLTGVVHNPTTDGELSFRFVYAVAKALEGTKGYEQFWRTTGANDGTYPALVAQVIRKFGVPLAKYCPNTVSLSADDFCYGRVLENIPKEAFIDAQTRKAGADFAVPCTEEGIKQAITYAKANKGAVAILRRVGNTYWTDKNGVSSWDKNKILPIRVPKEFTSGHEELLYGYDKEPGTGRTRIYWLNHWSPQWADNGRAWEYLDEWLPYIKEIRVSVAYVPVVDNFKYNFTKTLKKGDKGPDVVALQHVLKLENCFDFPSFTGNFSDLTFAGVVKLQEKHADEILAPLGLTHGTGFVGNATVAWLKKHYGV